ncbi:MAG: GAF domain-containing sensor histidine kinase, partial [Gemmatimonadaceae bacterium]
MSARHDLAILDALAHRLAQSLDVAHILETALDTLDELLRLETSWAWLYDETTGLARVAASRALPPGLADHPERLEGTCFCLGTYAAGDMRGAANVNVVWCTRLAKLVDDATGLSCHASVPLYAGERKLGLLNVASADWRELSEDELSLLYTVGTLVSLAIERTRLAARDAELAAAEERNRIARDIHDTIAQQLAGIAMQLESAEAFVGANNDPRAATTIRRALDLTRAALHDARRSVLELRTSPLAGRDLLSAVRALPREIGQALGRDVNVVVTGSGMMQRLPTALEIGLYRIVCEAMTNAMRHAGATTISVHVDRRGKRVKARVTDDGAGFELDAVPQTRFGLLGMNERARLLGGALRIESAPGSGTTIEATIPV